MNTAPGTPDRRTIKVRDFLDDYRTEVGDLELMTKYSLSIRGLEKFVQLLVDRKILSVDEVDLRNEKLACAEPEKSTPDTEHSAYMCPSCLITWPEMFDVCPNCGVLVQEYMAAQAVPAETAVDADDHSPDTDISQASDHFHGEDISPVFVASDESGDKAPIEIPLFETEPEAATDASEPFEAESALPTPPYVWAEKSPGTQRVR